MEKITVWDKIHYKIRGKKPSPRWMPYIGIVIGYTSPAIMLTMGFVGIVAKRLDIAIAGFAVMLILGILAYTWDKRWGYVDAIYKKYLENRQILEVKMAGEKK